MTLDEFIRRERVTERRGGSRAARKEQGVERAGERGDRDGDPSLNLGVTREQPSTGVTGVFFKVWRVKRSFQACLGLSGVLHPFEGSCTVVAVFSLH